MYHTECNKTQHDIHFQLHQLDTRNKFLSVQGSWVQYISLFRYEVDDFLEDFLLDLEIWSCFIGICSKSIAKIKFPVQGKN